MRLTLTERDLFLIVHLALFGSLSTQEIHILLDKMNLKNLQKRLLKMKKAGFLESMPLPSFTLGRSSYLWYLSPQGAEFANEPYSKPKITLKYNHRLTCNSLLIAVEKSFTPDIKCRILPEHQIRKNGQKLIPDGAFMPGNAMFVFEYDAGNEIISSPNCNSDIHTKLIAYAQMYEENALDFYEKHFCAKINRFRLLFVVNSFSRLNSIAEIVKETDKHGFIWLTTKTLFEKHSVKGNIFTVPSLGKENCSIIGE